jgi:hypothetical protein
MTAYRMIATDGGNHRMIDGAAIDKFAAGLRGALLAGGHAEYEAARRVWNGMIDRRPALIARCLGTADVLACVRFARDNDILVSVRGGGHNYAGKSVCADGLMIDLSLMKGIRVDPAGRIAQAQPGLRLGEFDRETQAFGLATTLGVNTDTGIAGLTLGGGYGWLSGQFGLACDICWRPTSSPPMAGCCMRVEQKMRIFFGVCAAPGPIWGSSRRSTIACIQWGRCSVGW